VRRRHRPAAAAAAAAAHGIAGDDVGLVAAVVEQGQEFVHMVFFYV
jgi:hypothetical protein